MSLTVGKKQVAAMVAVLEAEHETLDDAAKAALEVAEAIFEERAKYVVVGQVVETKDKGKLEPGDPDAVKVSLGWYSTEGNARSAAESLWSSTASGDRLLNWVLPVFHGSPAAWHLTQRDKYAAEEQKRKVEATERFKLDIEKRRLAMEVRAAGGKGSCQQCTHQPYDHMTDGSSRGRCALCKCPKWEEKKK